MTELENIKDPIEEEYITSKSIYEMMGLAQTPTDPIEAAKASYHYKMAQKRYFKAEGELYKTFERF